MIKNKNEFIEPTLMVTSDIPFRPLEAKVLAYQQFDLHTFALEKQCFSF